jgi:hypothetical protein
VPTVLEGDFEWDLAKAASNLKKHDVSFFEAATVFADPTPCTWTTVRGWGLLWSSGRRCVSASSMWSTSSAESAIGSSVRVQRSAESVQSMKRENRYEPSTEATARF